MPTGPTTPRRRPRRPARVGGGAVWLVLALIAALAGPAGADEDPDPASDPHAGIVAAWRARNADAVVASVPEDGTLRLDLMTPPVRGTYRRAQALRTLKAYFPKVAGVALVDVTSPRHQDVPGYRVRHYDYTYRPSGRDPVTTRLVITLKSDAAGAWHLDSVTERPRPRGTGG
jgi:hypothetical protein